MKATIIYPKGNLHNGRVGGIRPEDFFMPIEIVQEGTDLQLCEIAWRMMNRVDGSPVERYLEKYQERSMMIGDIVILHKPEGDVKFRVTASGWRVMPNTEANEFDFRQAYKE